MLFSHAMKILLQSGINSLAAVKIAGTAISKTNQHNIAYLLESLNEGKSFSQSFKSSSWFAPIFFDYIAAAENTGNLRAGFDQVFQNLNRKKEEQFATWSSFIEPVVMIILGALVLAIMISIYLPLFELGNKI